MFEEDEYMMHKSVTPHLSYQELPGYGSQRKCEPHLLHPQVLYHIPD